MKRESSLKQSSSRQYGLVAHGPLSSLLIMVLLLALAGTTASDFILSDEESDIYFQLVIAAGDKIKIDKGTDIDGSLHSNTKIDLKKDTRVDGTVSAVEKIKNKGTVTGAVTEGAPVRDLPVILAEAELRVLADRVFERDTTFKDEVIDDVVFVDGKVKIKGDLNGRGTVIATREIKLEAGGGKSGGGGIFLAPDTRLSLIALRDIRIDKGRPFRGVLRAGRDIALDKNVVFEGVLVADRKVDVGKDSTINSIFFDQEPPQLTLLSPEDGSLLDIGTPSITAEYSDNLTGIQVVGIQVLIDGIDFTAEAVITETGLSLVPAAPLADGEHTLEIMVPDLANNVASASSSFTTDATPPVLNIVSPTSGQLFNQSSVVVSGSAGDRIADLVVGGQPAPLTGDQFSAPAAVTQGSNELTVIATDTLGRQTVATVDVLVDTVPPELNLETPFPGAHTNEATIRFAGRVNDASEVASLDIDGTPVTMVDGRFDADVALPEGPSTVTVRAVDAVGNVGERTVDVTRVTIPKVTVTSPDPFSLAPTAAVDIAGTVSPGAAVWVNSVEASVTDGDFLASGLPLADGRNVFDIIATSQTGAQSTAKVVVFRDDTAPRLDIYDPPNGRVVNEPTVTVRGMINEVSAGALGAEPPTLSVNGVPAVIANGTFLATGVPLQPGTNTLVATAVDGTGNVGEASVEVTFEAPIGARIRVASGDLQSAPIGSTLPEPLTVAVTDAAGQPMAGSPVFFRVTENDGTLEGGQRRVVATTDAAGRAAVGFTLGTRAGAGSQQVLATAPGILGQALFMASAEPGVPAHLVIDSGDQQHGATGRPLPDPLVAVVTDAGHNRLAGVEVAFRVAGGTGVFANGQQEILVESDAAGKVSTVFQIGAQEGVGNNVVQASVAADPAIRFATFSASGLGAGDPSATSIVGVVLDNTDQPVPGVTVHVAGTSLSTETDSMGFFDLQGAPVGSLLLETDGSTASRPGTWPHLEFEMTTIPGRINSLGRPIYMLPLDVTRGVTVSETEGGTLTLPEVPGFALEVAPGSVTFPDGGRSGMVSVTVVHGDKVPMVPNFGQQPRFVITIQPSGAKFDPPAPLSLPNVDGLSPGQVVELYSFDHDLGSFVSIGPGTVSEDGSTVRSNRGVGVIEAGWHCGGLPPTFGTPEDCPECAPCDGSFCRPVQSSRSCDDEDECTFNDHCEGADCVGTPIRVDDVKGPCVAAVGESVTFTAVANNTSKIKWSSDGTNTSQEGGGSFSTTFEAAGPGNASASACGSGDSKTVEIKEPCSDFEPPIVREFPTSKPPGPGAFGQVTHQPPAATFVACVNGGQWCFRLHSVLQRYDIGVAPQGRIPIDDENDPDIGPATCQPILDDFTPSVPRPGVPGVLLPPQQTYVYMPAIQRHEDQHVSDYRNIVLDPLVALLQMEANNQPCTTCPSPVPRRLQGAKWFHWFRLISQYNRQKEQLPSAEDDRQYLDLTNKIRARAQQEGWSCQ